MRIKMILQIYRQRITRAVVGKGLAYFLLACGWFSVLYPELLLLPDTYQKVDILDENDDSTVQIRFGYAKDVQYLIEQLRKVIE